MYRSGNKDEYDIIYDYDGLDIEERMEDLRGNIGRGTCLYCGAENGIWGPYMLYMFKMWQICIWRYILLLGCRRLGRVRRIARIKHIAYYRKE